MPVATPQSIASARVLARIGSYVANRNGILCQNCVTCPPKPPSNTVVYGDTSTHKRVAITYGCLQELAGHGEGRASMIVISGETGIALFS